MTHLARNNEKSTPVMPCAGTCPPAGGPDGSITNMNGVLW
jgi:hypothetical protein